MLEGSFSYSVAIRTLGKAGDMFSRLIYSLKSQTIPPSGIYVYIAEGYELPPNDFLTKDSMGVLQISLAP